MWLGCLTNAGHRVNYPYSGYVEPGLIQLSDLALVNNFTVLDPWQFGVTFPTLEPIIRVSPLAAYLWYPDWIAGYRMISGAGASS